MELLHLGDQGGTLAERADYPNPALLGRLEQLASTAITLSTTVRTVVNLDPSSAQAQSDEMRTSLSPACFFHEVLFDHDHPPPAVMAGRNGRDRRARDYRGTTETSMHRGPFTWVRLQTTAVAKPPGSGGLALRSRPLRPPTGWRRPTESSPTPPGPALGPALSTRPSTRRVAQRRLS